MAVRQDDPTGSASPADAGFDRMPARGVPGRAEVFISRTAALRDLL